MHRFQNAKRTYITVSLQKSSPRKNLPSLELSSGFNFWALPPWHARFQGNRPLDLPQPDCPPKIPPPNNFPPLRKSRAGRGGEILGRILSVDKILQVKLLEIADTPLSVAARASFLPATLLCNCGAFQIVAGWTIFCKLEHGSRVTLSMNFTE